MAKQTTPFSVLGQSYGILAPVSSPFLSPIEVEQGSITLVSAHALEREGVNAIPEAMAEVLASSLGWEVEHQVVQTNIVTVEISQIHELEQKHGEDLRQWWRNRFGFDYDCLTSSEARYLIRTPSADLIRDLIVAAVEEGSR